jgi:hypothetical protein
MAFKGFEKDDDFEDSEDDSIITLSGGNTTTRKGIRYRKFILELPGYHRQDLIYHYLITLKQADCKKVYYHGSWYYEIKKHDPCPLECVDQYG